MSIANSKQVSF